MRVQVSRSCASTSVCFTSWAKCLQQRQFHSLSSAAGRAAADALHRRHVQHADGSSRGDRDALQEGLWIELDKVPPSLRSQPSSVGLTRSCRWQSENTLTLHVAQLHKKLNDMQGVHIKGVKFTVESIRAGRAGLGGGAAGALGPASDD